MRMLLMVVEVDDWKYDYYAKRGVGDNEKAELIADDYLSANGEYAGPNLVKALWVEEE